MTERHQQNPTGRFSGLADVYAANRPTYPSDAIDFIMAACSLQKDSLIADIGCGTGISSRLFVERGCTVHGIEPNDDMRNKAEEARLDTPVESKPGILTYTKGTAEDTGLSSDSVDLVLSAQAFHWFDPEKALPEFKRILKPQAWVALMWNERDESDPFTAMYGDLFRTLPDTAGVEIPRGKAGNALLESSLFDHRQRDLFTGSQFLDEEGLVGRAFSASYAPKAPELRAQFEKSLRTLFHAYAQRREPEGPLMVRFHFATSVYTGQKID